LVSFPYSYSGSADYAAASFIYEQLYRMAGTVFF
jgi:hypothetical protein